MRVLVTGGLGFIGSHLCKQLVAQGFNVRCFDNLSKGKIENIDENTQRNVNFEFLEGDLLNIDDVAKAVTDVDTVYHLGAIVGVKNYVESPLRVIEVNVLGTHNLLEASRRNDVPRIVFASTSEVYGKNIDIPLKEDAERILGATSIDRWCYSTSKALDEHACYAYYRQYGLRIVILRYFNAYGPKQECSDYGNVIPIFIRRVLNDQTPRVHGDGKQTRAFTYIDDIVNGTILAAEKKEAIGETINLGCSQETCVLELANCIIRFAGKETQLKPVFVPYEEVYGSFYEDVERRVPDISKARRILGYEPRISLRQGLLKTIQWYEQHPERLKPSTEMERIPPIIPETLVR
jgi:UDP-glucose 4-epimerase